jgi:integrase
MASIIKLEGKKGVTYKAVIRRQGFKTVTRNFSTRKAAREWARDTEGNIERLTRLGGTGSRITLAELIDDYAREYRGNDISALQRLDYWKTRLGDWRVGSITRQLVSEELKRLRKEPALQPLRKHESKPTSRIRSQPTVNRYLSALSKVLGNAVKDGLIETNPCRGISREGERSRFGRALSDEERARLLEQCKVSQWERLHLLVTLALSTGARCGELFSLTWNDIDVKKGIARLSETKNGSPRHLPLIPSVLDQIKALPRPIDTTVCVFPSETDLHKSYYHGFRKHWDEALEDAGIQDFRFHDLRHSAASYLTEKGVPLVIVAEILGHKTMAMVQRYSHVHTEQKAKVVAQVFGDLLG